MPQGTPKLAVLVKSQPLHSGSRHPTKQMCFAPALQLEAAHSYSIASTNPEPGADLRCAQPASLMRAPNRSSARSLTSDVRCARPSSVTWRLSRLRCVSPDSAATACSPASLTPAGQEFGGFKGLSGLKVTWGLSRFRCVRLSVPPLPAAPHHSRLRNRVIVRTIGCSMAGYCQSACRSVLLTPEAALGFEARGQSSYLAIANGRTLT